MARAKTNKSHAKVDEEKWGEEEGGLCTRMSLLWVGRLKWPKTGRTRGGGGRVGVVVR